MLHVEKRAQALSPVPPRALFCPRKLCDVSGSSRCPECRRYPCGCDEDQVQPQHPGLLGRTSTATVYLEDGLPMWC